jgi:hypothetical protein
MLLSGVPHTVDRVLVMSMLTSMFGNRSLLSRFVNLIIGEWVPPHASHHCILLLSLFDVAVGVQNIVAVLVFLIIFFFCLSLLLHFVVAVAISNIDVVVVAIAAYMLLLLSLLLLSF